MAWARDGIAGSSGVFEEDSTSLGLLLVAGVRSARDDEGVHNEGETGIWRRKASDFSVVTVTDGFNWPVASYLRSIAGRGKIYGCGWRVLSSSMTSLRISGNPITVMTETSCVSVWWLHRVCLYVYVCHLSHRTRLCHDSVSDSPQQLFVIVLCLHDCGCVCLSCSFGWCCCGRPRDVFIFCQRSQC